MGRGAYLGILDRSIAIYAQPGGGLPSCQLMTLHAMMPPSSTSPTCETVAWKSLVERSIATWKTIAWDNTRADNMATSFLEHYKSVDDLLCPDHALHPMFWFFQMRQPFLSQTTMRKWSRSNFDDYVLLPALPGFVTRTECFFVSHFWRGKRNPDPHGIYLRKFQAELKEQSWSYIWVDWICMPQDPRTANEALYFGRCLKTVSGIIRNCGFVYFYPPFEPRLWILYEITEYLLTCEGGLAPTPDIETYIAHIKEMSEHGVESTLAKHKYRCSQSRDREYLTSWLELLVLLKRVALDVNMVRSIMNAVTWQDPLVYHFYDEVTKKSLIELHKYEGYLRVLDVEHSFKPWPKWETGKYARSLGFEMPVRRDIFPMFPEAVQP